LEIPPDDDDDDDELQNLAEQVKESNSALGVAVAERS